MESEREIVTCQFVADDWIDEVYYNNNDIRNSVQNVNNPVSLKELQFTPEDGGVLAIATKDNEPGTSAVFGFKCSSNKHNSYWNFELDVNNGKLYEVRTYGIVGSHRNLGPLKRPVDKQPHKDWYKNNFDDDSWGFPTVPTNDFLAISHDMSGVWYKEFKYTFFRFNPRKVKLEHLEKMRQQQDILQNKLSALVRQHGYNVINAKYRLSIDEGEENIGHTDELEEVTCRFVGEGLIDKVYYGDEDVKDKVKNINSQRELLKTFKFSPKDNNVLAISANGKAFGFQCSSTYPDSYWNFSLDNYSCRLHEVRSSGSPTLEHLQEDWYTKDFDDSSWEYPTQAASDFLTKFHHMSRVWHKDSKCVFFRFNPQKVDLECLAKERDDTVVLSNKASSLAKNMGFSIDGLKLRKYENTDVNDLLNKPANTANSIKEDDNPINQKIINYVADRIAKDWKCLGRHLTLDEPKIDQIECDNPSTYERSLKCQHAWLQMSRCVSWSDLKDALKAIPRNDIVRDVEEKFSDLILKDFEGGGKKTFFTKRKFDIDTSFRLDASDDKNKFPKVYHGVMWEGFKEVPIAVKTFAIENNEHKENLKANADLMYELRNHHECPNIVKLIDYSEEESRQFILILERCEFDMKQYLGFSEFEIPEKTKQLIEWTKSSISHKEIAKNVLNGLEHVHKNHHGSTFMHRDIKPSNILFKVSENHIIVKLSDFGISKKTQFSRNVTTTSLDKGTDLYTPNDIRKKAMRKLKQIEVSDLKMADMFAFGVTLNQLIAGVHPFGGKSDTWTSCNIEEGKRTAVFELKDKMALNLIFNLTESNPNDRLTASEVKVHHPWFFPHATIMMFLKQLQIVLSDSGINGEAKKLFEESRQFANDGDWRRHLPKENSSNVGVYLKDQLTFIVKTIESCNEKNNTYVNNVFGKKQPSNAEIIGHLINGDEAIFPSFFIHVYCKAAELFPTCAIVNNDAARKISRSYNRYVEEVKKMNPVDHESKESMIHHGNEREDVNNSNNNNVITNGKLDDASLKEKRFSIFKKSKSKSVR